MNLQQLCAFIVNRQWLPRKTVEKIIQAYRSQPRKMHFLDFLLQNSPLNQNQYRQLRQLLESNSNTRTSQTQQRAWLQGSNFKKYKIVKELGQGGMGKVYLAQDQDLKRHVALKISRTMDREMLTRFIKEAQIGSQLEHPNIAPVYDAGTTPDQRIYITMKYIEGTSLMEILESLKKGKGKFKDEYPLRRRLEIFIKVLEGMEYAHAKGFVHRDIKPENIMVGRFGEVWIVDWGLAKVASLDEPRDFVDSELETEALKEIVATRTQSGTITGTPSYMSPEQAYGDQENISARSDIFALGTVLYEILTLRLAFGGKTGLEVLNKVAENQYLSPSEAAKFQGLSLPPALEAITCKAMEYYPTDRYQSVGKMREDLQNYLEDSPISVYTPPLQKRFMKFVRQYSGTLLASWLVLATLTTMGYFWMRETQKLLLTEKKKLAAEKEARRAVAKEKEALKEKEEALKEKEEALVAQKKAMDKAKHLEKEKRDRLENRIKAQGPYFLALDRMQRSMRFEVIKKSVIPLLQKAIKIDPRYTPPYLQLIRVYFYLSREMETLSTFLAMINHQPPQKREEYQQIIETLRPLIMTFTMGTKINPDHKKKILAEFEKSRPEEMPQVFWDLLKCLLLYQARFIDTAHRVVNDILARPEGQTWEVFHLKALILNRKLLRLRGRQNRKKYLEHLQEAFRSANQALRFYPHIPYLYMNRAMLYVRQGNFDKAMKDYYSLLTRDPTCNVGWRALGKLYFSRTIAARRQKKTKETLAHLATSLLFFYRSLLLEPGGIKAGHFYSRQIRKISADMLQIPKATTLTRLVQSDSFRQALEEKFQSSSSVLARKWAILTLLQLKEKKLFEMGEGKRAKVEKARRILQSYCRERKETLDYVWSEKLLARYEEQAK